MCVYMGLTSSHILMIEMIQSESFPSSHLDARSNSPCKEMLPLALQDPEEVILLCDHFLDRPKPTELR